VQPAHRTPLLPWIALAAILGSTLMPQASRAETLTEALAATLETNPVLGAQREQLAATGESAEIARSGFFPRLTLAASAGRGTLPNVTPVVPVAANAGFDQASWGYSATLEQPLFDGMRTYNSYQEAQEAELAAQDDLRAVRQGVILQAVKAYMAVLGDRLALEQRKKSVAMLAKDLEITNRLETQGHATRTEIDQTAGRLALARVTEAAALSALSASQAGFAATVGHEAGPLTWPALPSAGLPADLDLAKSDAIRNHPELGAARRRAKAATFAIDRVTADFLPQVSLNASYGRTYSNPPAVTDNGDAQLTAQVSLPISLGGEAIAKLRQAKFVLRQRKQDVAAKQREIAAQLSAAWSALANLRKQTAFSRAAVTSTGRALQGIRQQREMGEATALDVINAEQALADARLQEIRSSGDLVVAAYEVLAATGGLSPTGDTP